MGKWNLKIVVTQTLLYDDDIVLIADSVQNLQQAVVEWEAELERKGMNINANKSKIMQIGREYEEVHILYIFR